MPAASDFPNARFDSATVASENQSSQTQKQPEALEITELSFSHLSDPESSVDRAIVNIMDAELCDSLDSKFIVCETSPH